MYGHGSGTEKPASGDPSEVLPVVEEPGKIIGGRYEILRNLAEGGMGSVYVARQVDLNRSVALKVIGGEDQDLNERFRREAVALADISHPAVVEVHDFIGPSEATGGRSYLVMAFVPGHNLDDHLKSIPEAHMPAAGLVDLFLPVASAVVELHASGIIHRDLKPGNLVFAARADGHSSIKLVDFGIAKRELEEGLTAAGFVLGTPAYMAPEAMVGGEKTPAGDVFALGATMFELATGEAPFGSGSTADILKRIMMEDPELPNHLQSTSFGALLLRMLARDKDHRPDALQVFQELEKIEHELYRPPSQPILPVVHPPPDTDTDAAPGSDAYAAEVAAAEQAEAELVAAAAAAEAAANEIPLGESPLITMEPPDRPEARPRDAAEPEPVLHSEPDSASLPAFERPPKPVPPPRNWAKLFVLVVGPMVLVALAAGVWLRMDGRRSNPKKTPVSDATLAYMEPASMEPTAMEPAAMEPAAMEPAAMEPAAMEPASMEPAAMEPAAKEPAVVAPKYVGPSRAKLKRGCRKTEGAKKLHRKARRAMRKPATRSFAERALQVLMECKGSKRWRQRRAAQQLANLYVLMGRCADAKTAWKAYVDRLPNAKKKKGPPPAPNCPAPAP